MILCRYDHIITDQEDSQSFQKMQLDRPDLYHTPHKSFNPAPFPLPRPPSRTNHLFYLILFSPLLLHLSILSCNHSHPNPSGPKVSSPPPPPSLLWHLFTLILSQRPHVNGVSVIPAYVISRLIPSILTIKYKKMSDQGLEKKEYSPLHNQQSVVASGEEWRGKGRSEEGQNKLGGFFWGRDGIGFQICASVQWFQHVYKHLVLSPP